MKKSSQMGKASMKGAVPALGITMTVKKVMPNAGTAPFINYTTRGALYIAVSNYPKVNLLDDL